MEVWQTILIAFGGNAALLAVLGWLGKSLLDKLIVRDTKIFEANLARTTQSELERLREEMTRRLESYKVQLKKSEVFFERELAAASAFTALFKSVTPTYSCPDMEWYEACDEIALEFANTELTLGDFLRAHGALLNDEERDILVSAIADAGNGKFLVTRGEVSTEANSLADEMFEKLRALEDKLIKRVRAQASL